MTLRHRPYNPGCRPWLAALAVTLGAIGLAPGARPDEATATPAAAVDAAEIAERLIADGELPSNDVAISATMFEDGALDPTASADADTAVMVEARIELPSSWVPGSAVEVALVAFTIDDEPLVQREVVVPEASTADREWVYRGRLDLPVDFLEAVLVVAYEAGGARAASRVGFGGRAVAPAQLPTAVAPAAPQLAAAAPAPGRLSLLRLVPPVGDRLTGRVRIRTLVSSDLIAAVTFAVDGEVVATDDRPPFTVDVDLGATGRATEVTAVATSATGVELGRDRLALNERLERFDVRLISLEPAASDPASVQAEARITVPRGATIASVEFFRNTSLIARRTKPPWTATLPSGTTSDYVRVVASLADGRRLEDVLLLSAQRAGSSVDVNLVEVFAVATDRSGEPLSDLAREEFELRLDGRRVEIERFERAVDLPLSLGLVLDTSGSMTPLMTETKQAGARFLGSIVRSGDRAFLVDFDSRPRLAHPPTDDIGSLLRRFGALEPRGGTALYDAVVFSCLQFDEALRRRALVVLTDGKPQGGEFGARESVRQAVEHGVPVYLIDLSGVFGGRGVAKMPLVGLAKATGGRVYTVPPVDPLLPDIEAVRRSLEEAYDRIERELRSQYVLAFSTAERWTADELERLEVRVRRPRVKVRRVVGPATAP